MKLTSFLFRKIVLIHVEMGKNGIERKEETSVRFSKEKAVIGKWKDFEIDTISKWKNVPVLIIITGEGIISKIYDKQDITDKRIIKDPDFIWNIETENGQGQILSFLRRDKLSNLLQVFKQHHLVLIDMWIYGTGVKYDVQKRLDKLYIEHFKSSMLLKSPDYKDILANVIFQKIFFPVLLLFFTLLLGNYFLNSYYTKQYQQMQSVIQQDERKNRVNSLEEQKKNQLLAGYNQIPNQSFALLADRIASYVPANLYLTSLNIFPIEKNSNTRDKSTLPLDFHIIRLKGTVETPGSVTLLSQLLESDSLFEKVKVVQIGRMKNTNLFEFELEINL